MLQGLAIRDVVVIRSLNVDFGRGLTVLTGETGAGKSILLDSLGLALGQRADSGLVRSGAPQASVVARFELPPVHPVIAMAAEQGIALEQGVKVELLLKRVLTNDGRSRAFINDQPVGVAALRRIGESLIDVHGQFENQRLLSQAVHRGLLDSFGALDAQAGRVGQAFRAWRMASDALDEAIRNVAETRREEDYLRHAFDELEKLNPQRDEEAELATRRQLLMNGERIVEALNRASDALSAGGGLDAQLQGAVRALVRGAPQAGGLFERPLAALERAQAEVAEAEAELARATAGLETDAAADAHVEERLFALRAAARKHGVAVAALSDVRNGMRAKLEDIDHGERHIEALQRDARALRDAFANAARVLSAARAKAAKGLEKAVATELGPLRLGASCFMVSLQDLAEADWGEQGAERVVFMAATNPGTAAGPLAKVSSGGELARFMLALKVVLARADPVPTIVFDEVDSGVGGAVAAAVGGCLAKLGRDFQVLVVTHSPQVAAVGHHHLKVSKSNTAGTVATTVALLAAADRQEEIARMLAGKHVTVEARAAAARLLEGAGEAAFGAPR